MPAKAAASPSGSRAGSKLAQARLWRGTNCRGAEALGCLGLALPLKLPLSYIPLAKGDSWSYLFLEMLYDVLIVVSVIVFFRTYGLMGAGIAITVTGIL